jgi:hypothetical protein
MRKEVKLYGFTTSALGGCELSSCSDRFNPMIDDSVHDLKAAEWSKIKVLEKVAKKSGFGCLEVACWLLVPKFTGSNPAEAVGFFRVKKSSARLPRRGSKSRPVPCRRFAACKRTLKVALTRHFQAKFTGHFSPNSSTFHC